MEIKIEAHKLVKILIKANIEPTSAKSLVFDILSEQSGVEIVNDESIIDNEPTIERTNVNNQRIKLNSQRNQVEEEYDDDQTKHQQPQQQLTRVKQNNQQMNFSKFGGNYNGISK